MGTFFCYTDKIIKNQAIESIIKVLVGEMKKKNISGNVIHINGKIKNQN